jgi:hypothetical protein
MEVYTIRGTVTPYPNGSRVECILNGYKGTIVKECYCSSKYLHYEILIDGADRLSIYEHKELKLIES